MLKNKNNCQPVITLLLPITFIQNKKHVLVAQYPLKRRTYVCLLHEWSLWSVQYLYRVSQQFQIPQQDKIMNVFTLLNFPNLKQNNKWIMPFIMVDYSSSFCFNLVNKLILMRVCHWFYSFFWRFSQINTWFFSKLMEHKRWRFWRPDRLLILFKDKSRTCRLFRSSNPSVSFSWFPLWIETGKGGTFEDKARTWSSWICTQDSFFTQSMIPTHKY